MGTIGIIGGLGPESTIEYYRLILAFYREQKKDGSNPPILINSVNMKRLLDLITAGELREAAGYLFEEVERLAKGGASFGLISANTPHIVFETVQAASPIQLLSIVEETCDAAASL